MQKKSKSLEEKTAFTPKPVHSLDFKTWFWMWAEGDKHALFKSRCYGKKCEMVAWIVLYGITKTLRWFTSKSWLPSYFMSIKYTPCRQRITNHGSGKKQLGEPICLPVLGNHNDMQQKPVTESTKKKNAYLYWLKTNSARIYTIIRLTGLNSYSYHPFVQSMWNLRENNAKYWPKRKHLKESNHIISLARTAT